MNAEAKKVDVLAKGTMVRIATLDESDREDGLEVGDAGVVTDHEYDSADDADIVYVKFDCGVQKWMEPGQLARVGGAA